MRYFRDAGLRRSGALFVVGMLAIGVLVAAGPLAQQDSARIKAVVRASIEDVFDAATFKEPDWRGGRLNNQAEAAMHVTLDARLSSHMTGDALAHWGGSLHEAIDRDSDGEHVVVTAGGVDKIEFEESWTEDGVTQTSGRVHHWITYIILDKSVQGPQAGRPEQWSRFSASVVSRDGSWLVETLNLQPEQPGP